MKVVVIGSTCLIGSRLVSILRSKGHEVLAEAHARYFGAELNEQSLVAGPGARVGAKHFEDWLQESVAATRVTR